MRYFIMAFAAVISLAFATEVFADTSSRPSPPPSPMAKLANGRGNDCASGFYPPEAVRREEEGSTTLTVHIDADGKPTGADISTSSGFADLDQASRDCVMRKWHFSPAMQDGRPVASTKQYRIVWKLRGGSAPPRLLTPMEVSCADIFTDAKPRWTSYQSATLQFRISDKGSVIFPFVAISSGDTLFDAKAVRCATRLRYNAGVIDDAPTELSWSADVRWSPRTGLAYTDPYRLGPHCSDSAFPPDLWKGDPPEGTVISFHIVGSGEVAGAAIERSSGNPALDQAALKCIQDWRSPWASMIATSGDVGDVVLFNWREGHAFVLDDTSR
jgi:TonB family protein